MTPDDQPHDGRDLDAVDDLYHKLKSPLTTISGRTQLLTRAVRLSPSLSTEERDWLLYGLASIEATVQLLVVVIDGIAPGDVDRDRRDSLE